jgi:GNAT superfamily N-acetyltransferase
MTQSGAVQPGTQVRRQSLTYKLDRLTLQKGIRRRSYATTDRAMIEIREMTEADISLGMRLSRAEGWNQTAADWLRFLKLQPGGCFVAEEGGLPVATVTTCVFQRVAWIGMMLVHKESRGRGIGRALMERALQWLDEQGVVSVRLDATAMGKPMYEKLGFEPQFDIGRFAGQVSDAIARPPTALADKICLDEICALDRAAIGYDRTRLIRALLSEKDAWANVMRSSDRLLGYVSTRAGSIATFVGPCAAETPTAGRQLLAGALRVTAGRQVFVDVPLDNRPAVETVDSTGLTQARQLIRMTCGPLVVEKIEWLWASSGPEKG